MSVIRTTRLAVFSALLFLILVGACAPGTKPTPTARVLIDGQGREVSLAQPVERIVSIAPSTTEVLFAIGAGDLVVGRDETSDYPPEVAEIASIGSTYGDLNTEAIVALEPDLVMAAMINSPEHIEAIEALGIPVFVLPNPMEFEALYDTLVLAGMLTEHEAQAQTLASELEARVNAVLVSLDGVSPVSVYYEVDGTDPTAPWTVGAGTFQNVLIDLAGGSNIVGDMEGYLMLSLEELVARDPQVMIFSLGPWVTTTAESVGERAGWGEISAVANGEIYGIDANWLDRPGPRLVDALEAMAQTFHPERFE